MLQFFDKRDPWGLRLGLWVLVSMAFTLPLAAWGVACLHVENAPEQWMTGDSPLARQFAWFNQSFTPEATLVVSWDSSSVEDPRVDLLALRLCGTADAEGIRRGGVKQVSSVQSPHQFLNRMAEVQIDRTEAIHRITGIVAGPGRIWCNFSTPALNQKTKSIRTLRDATAERFGINLRIVEPSITVPSEEDELAEEEALAAAEVPPTTSKDESAEIAGSPSPATAVATPTGELDTPVDASLAMVEEAKQHDIEISWPHMHVDPIQIADFIAWAQELKLRVPGENAEESLLSECYLHAGQPVALLVTLSEAGTADLAEALKQIQHAAVAVGIPADSLQLGGVPVEVAAFNRNAIQALWNSEAPWYRPVQCSVLLFSLFAGAACTFWILRDVRLSVIVLLTCLITTLTTTALISLFGGRINVLLLIVPILSWAMTILGTLHLAHCWKSEISRDGRQTTAQTVSAIRFTCILVAVIIALVAGSLLLSPSSVLRNFATFSAIGTLLPMLAALYAVPKLLQSWPDSREPVSTSNRGPWTQHGRHVVKHARSVMVAGVVLIAVSYYGFQYYRADFRMTQFEPKESQLLQNSRFLEENVTGLVPFETVVSFGKNAREELQFLQRLEIVRDIEGKLRKIPDISGALSLADFEPISEPLDDKAKGKKLLAFNSHSRSIESRLKRDTRAKSFFQVTPVDTEFSNAGDELWRISCRTTLLTKLEYRDLTDEIDQACRSVTKYHPDTRHIVTGLVPGSIAAQQLSLDNLNYSVGIGFLLITIGIMSMTRSVLAAVLALVPIALPIGVVLAVSTIVGYRFEMGSLIAASLSLAFSVDGTLHLITRYRDGVIAGLSHRRAVVKSLEHVAPVLWQSSLIIGLTMGVMYQSPFSLLSRFGGLSSAMIIATLFISLVMTPAMLAGPLGWLIFRAASKQRNRLKTVSEDPESGAPMRHDPHLAPPKPQIAEDPRHSRAHRFDEVPGSSRKKRK